MVSKQQLLAVLPPFTNTSVLIEKNQGVNDIVREVCEAHKFFENDYDLIAAYFNDADIKGICQRLFDFCKKNIRYKVETEDNQTTKSPAAIIALGDSVGGDCKHYASFIGGVLDAIKRSGKKIDWMYRFASYRMFDSTPGHVFVVVNDNGREIWIDPVLSEMNERLEPNYILDKKIKNMALRRVAGINSEMDVTMVDNDPEVSPQLEADLRLLLYYGILNDEAQVNDAVLNNLITQVSEPEYLKVYAAYQRVLDQAATINGFFGNVFKGVKKIVLAAPRNAFLSMVGLNVFGYASKLKRAISVPVGRDKLKSIWEGLGGNFTPLENTINKGSTKKQLLGIEETPNVIGVAPAAAVPAWVAVASAVIAAIMPVVKAILDKIGPGGNQQLPGGDLDPYPYGICDDGITPKTANGSCPAKSGNGIIQWAKENPIIAIGAAAGAAYVVMNRKKIFK
jgi:hypothetical protein